MEEAHQRHRSPFVDLEEEAASDHFGNSSQDEASLDPDLSQALHSPSPSFITPIAIFFDAGHASPDARTAPDHSTFFAEPSSPQSPTPDDVDSTSFLPTSPPSPSNHRFFPRNRKVSSSKDRSYSPSPSPSPSSPALVPEEPEPTNLSDTEYQPTTTSRPQRRRPKPLKKSVPTRSSRRTTIQSSQVKYPNLSDFEHTALPPRRGKPAHPRISKYPPRI